MSKPKDINYMRTSFWATRLLRRTGWTSDRLEEEIAKLEDSDKPFEGPTGRFRRYAKGQRSASHVQERNRKPSVVLLAEQLVPGSVWEYCFVLFDLLEEVLAWRKPHLASTRFAKRVQLEVLATALKRNCDDRINGERASADAKSRADIARGYTRLKRIYCAMLAIDRFPIECFFVFRDREPRGYVRLPTDRIRDAAAVSFPPTLRDLTIALALHLEAIEQMDALRCATTATLLSASLPALHSNDTPDFVAKNALALIEKELFQLEDLFVAQHHDRFVRSMAPKSGRELLFDFELLKAVGDHGNALHTSTSPSQVTYVLI